MDSGLRARAPFKISRKFNRILLIAAAVWTAYCAGSFAYHDADAKRHIIHLAKETARESIEKDMLYRYWAAGHGGVYVPVTGSTKPNPYLSFIKERDITTPSGRRLTLVNPAYMTRQVHELGRDYTGVQGHITSLRPLRPENAPDAWEEKALQFLAKGEKSYGEVAPHQGAEHYRLMLPLYVEKPCLTCHAAQGYALGDLRGGLSAAIPMEAFAHIEREHLVSEVKHFGGTWVLGIIGATLFAPYVRRRIAERETAEEALQQNLAFTQSIIDNEPECVKLLGPGGVLKFMNRAGLAMIDAEGPEAVLGRPVHSLVVPEHREMFLRLNERVFAGESGSLEFEMVGLRGSRRWLETQVVPLRGTDGSVESALAITRDITERKRAEDALRVSEERYRTIVNTASEGIVIIDPEDRVTFANERISAILGYELRDLLGRSILDHMHPTDHEDHHHQMSLRREGKGALYERRFIHRTGRDVWVLLSGAPLRNPDGSYAGAFGMFTDITERKQAVDALRKSEERLREAQRIGRMGNWKLDLSGQGLWWSDEVYSIFGMDPAQGVTFDAFIGRIHADDRSRVQEAIQDAVRRSLTAWQVEYRIELDDGTVRHLFETGTADTDGAGRVVRRRGIVQDITERRQAEERRKQLEQQLLQAQKIESIGRLAGGMAHDINNMLMPILGYAEIIGMRLPEEDPGREDLEQIVGAANRVRDMTRQLLAFARKQTLEARPLDINAVISQFGRILRRALRENIEIDMRLAPSIRTVVGDERQIEQVLLNLALNAQDSMPGGGRLRIATQDVDVDRLFADALPGMTPGRQVLITFADDGAGMDRETLEKIFEPFFTTKEAGRGTGLGLPTVYGIVKQHQGYIGVASATGRGTTFSIYLPAAGEAAAALRADDRPGLKRGSETVLVVEDQEEVLRIVRQQLGVLGYRVLTAAGSSAARAALGAHGSPPDLLITDVIMPGSNGRELYQELRRTYPLMKVLYMSGYPADVISTHDVLDRGVHFLRKPFSVQDLSEKVREALDGPASETPGTPASV